MVKFEMRHQEDDEGDNSQVIGSKDLRESFKERGTLKGSFSLNGFEFRNFQAKDGPGVVDALNRSTNQTGVTASINEDGHLVLDNNDPADIVIQLGAPFEEPAAQAGSVADEVLNKLKDAANRQESKPENTILDDLGLEATAPEAVPGNTSPGQSPDNPAYTGENAGASSGAVGGTAGAGKTANPTQIPSAPVADTGGEGQGKLADGRGRTGTGEGYHAKPDGTPAVLGTPNNPASGAADPAQEGNPGGGNNAV